jgi:hypothetical protein
MSNLLGSVSPGSIMNRNNSIQFKDRIENLKVQIQSMNVAQLNSFLTELNSKKNNMNDEHEQGLRGFAGIEDGGEEGYIDFVGDNMNGMVTWDEGNLKTYKMYLDDVKKLIALVQNRLNSGQGIKRKSSKRKRKSMRYMKNKRNSRKYKRY